MRKVKEFKKNLCKILGHEGFGKCSRCGKDIGWRVWEKVGMVIHNPFAITKLKFK